MASETREQQDGAWIVSNLRGLVNARLVTMVLIGVLTGYSISVLGEDVVVLPVLGSVPGLLLGTAGLVVAAVVYRRTDCCENCDRKACGCSGDCGDSCSTDS